MARLILVLVVVVLAACSRPNLQTKEAVEKAVREYLSSRQAQTGLDMNAMTVEVTTMSFEKDQATAGVYFKLKSGDGGMQMQYALDRKGDQWVVRGLTGMGSGPHVPGSTATAPGAAPERAGPLPAGHPQVGAKQ